MDWAGHFWRDETGQALMEYSLLIAFFALLAMAFAGSFTDSIRSIADTGQQRLEQASSGHGL